MGSLAAVKLLLDTHIFLWSLLEPTRLSERVSRELESHLNDLWLSPIVIWEVLMLAERGRVALEPDAATWVRRACQAAPFREAPPEPRGCLSEPGDRSGPSGSGGSILGRDRARVRPHPRDRRRSPTPFAPDRVAREHITKASQRQARFSRRVVAPYTSDSRRSASAKTSSRSRPFAPAISRSPCASNRRICRSCSARSYASTLSKTAAARPRCVMTRG